MDERRTQRLTETMRDELGEIIALELENPDLQGLAVSDIVVSRDLRVVTVLVAIPGKKDRHELVIDGLIKAKPFIKKELASRVTLFRMPELRFEAALQPTVASKVNYLMKKIRKGRPRDVESTEKTTKKPEA